MAEVAEISTPVETSSIDTSSTEPTNNVDTSTVAEPSEEITTTAETQAEESTDTVENKEQPTEKMYADKYKTVEELEKGYKNLEPIIQEKAKIEKELSELKAKKQEDYDRARLQREEQAKSKGYNSYDELQIDNQVKVKEFELYCYSIGQVDPALQEDVRQYLLNYQQTGDNRYLDLAKKYYDDTTKEQIAIKKEMVKQQLTGELQARQTQAFREHQKNFVNAIEQDADFKNFLSDITEDKAKLQTMRVMFHSGLIQSKEDMQALTTLYDQIKAEGYKQGLAKQKADAEIEEAKAKSVISTNNATSNFSIDKIPTYEQFKKMPQSQKDAVYKKYGDELFIKMK